MTMKLPMDMFMFQLSFKWKKVVKLLLLAIIASPMMQLTVFICVVWWVVHDITHDNITLRACFKMLERRTQRSWRKNIDITGSWAAFDDHHYQWRVCRWEGGWTFSRRVSIQWARRRKNSVQSFPNLFIKKSERALTTEAGSLYKYFTSYHIFECGFGDY